MSRTAFAIFFIAAAAACHHPNSVSNLQQDRAVEVDSNFVSNGELEVDVRHGHVFLYDALASTHPEMLKSGGRSGWPTVYLVDPPHQIAGPCALCALSPESDIYRLKKVPTSQVKWVRRYWGISAPSRYKPSDTDWSLVVALR